MAAKRGHARPAGVVEHITRKRIASELGRSRVRPEQFRYWSASGRENRKPMMNERGKSDPAVVAAKLANKAERSAAEPVEPRAGTKGNANQQHSGRTQSRETVSQVLARIRQTARERKKERFTALFHHINVELLRDAFFAIRREAAPGVDGVTWQDYAANVETNLHDLHARVQRGAYRALPSRRQYIPKPDGRQRPLAVAALEDKIVQRATATLLNAIYEEDFLGFSYGFRPGRSTQHAMDALVVGIGSRKVNWILDAGLIGPAPLRLQASIGRDECKHLLFGIDAAPSGHSDQMGKTITWLQGDAAELFEHRLLQRSLPVPPHRHVQQMDGVSGDLRIEIARSHDSLREMGAAFYDIEVVRHAPRPTRRRAKLAAAGECAVRHVPVERQQSEPRLDRYDVSERLRCVDRCDLTSP